MFTQHTPKRTYVYEFFKIENIKEIESFLNTLELILKTFSFSNKKNEEFKNVYYIVTAETKQKEMFCFYGLGFYNPQEKEEKKEEQPYQKVEELIKKEFNGSVITRLNLWAPKTDEEATPKTRGLRQMQIHEVTDDKTNIKKRTIRNDRGGFTLFFHFVDILKDEVYLRNIVLSRVLAFLVEILRGAPRSEETKEIEKIPNTFSDLKSDLSEIVQNQKELLSVNTLLNNSLLDFMKQTQISYSKLQAQEKSIYESAREMSRSKPFNLENRAEEVFVGAQTADVEEKSNSSTTIAVKTPKKLTPAESRDINQDLLNYWKQAPNPSEKDFFDGFLSRTKAYPITPVSLFTLKYESVRKTDWWRELMKEVKNIDKEK